MLKLFQFYSDKEFLNKTKAIWNNKNSYINTVINDQPLYSFKISKELSENMSLPEMEKYLDYDLNISMDVLLNDSNIKEESEKILHFIEMVQNSNYNPKEILFWYETGKDESKENTTDSSTWSRCYLEFENWESITSMEQVQEKMVK